jgi:hypothetical protein
MWIGIVKQLTNMAKLNSNQKVAQCRILLNQKETKNKKVRFCGLEKSLILHSWAEKRKKKEESWQLVVVEVDRQTTVWKEPASETRPMLAAKRTRPLEVEECASWSFLSVAFFFFLFLNQKKKKKWSLTQQAAWAKHISAFAGLSCVSALSTGMFASASLRRVENQSLCSPGQ